MAPTMAAANPDPTQKLQASVNLVLSQSGRIFKDQTKRSGRGASHTRDNLKKLFPIAISNFHDALDACESELHRARAVLRRELAARQAERMRQEQEEEQKRIAANARPTISANATQTQSVRKEPDAPLKAEEEDVVMLDTPTTANPTIGAQVFTDQGKPQETITKSKPQQSSNKDKKPLPQPISIPSSPPKDLKKDPDPPAASATDDLFEGNITPATADKDTSFDFDDIFNDLGGSTDDAMEVTTDAGDIDFGFAADTNDNSGGVSSLLPGLENYANIADSGSGDGTNATEFQFDIPAADTDTNNANTTSAAQDITLTDNMHSTGDQTLDDLLDNFDMPGDAGGDQSQFDDAFWGM